MQNMGRLGHRLLVGFLLAMCAPSCAVDVCDVNMLPQQCANKLQQQGTQLAQQQGQLAQQKGQLALVRNTAGRSRLAQRLPDHGLLALATDAGADAGEVQMVAPPPSPWRSAMAVAVDNNPAAAAKDVPDCGIAGQPRCLTIRYGVSRALPNATVTVWGGGVPYRGECGGAPDALSSSSGIQPPAGASLTVDGVGGRVVIDCEGQGRAFGFNASSTSAAPEPGKGATLMLRGLEVRNGNALGGSGGAVTGIGGTLVLEGTVLTDCKAAQGGGLQLRDGQLRVSGSSFVRCVASNVGGGICTGIIADLVDLAVIDIYATNFTDTFAVNGGGGAYFTFRAGGGVTRTTMCVRNSRFTNTTAFGPNPKHDGKGGGMFIGYFGAQNEDVVTQVLGCVFDRARSAYVGGALWVYHNTHALRPVTLLEGCSFARTVSKTGAGGGTQISYYSGATDAETTVDGCDFEGTRSEAEAAGFGGGGLEIGYLSQANNVRTIISGSSFRDSFAGGYGGGAQVEFLCPSTNTDTRILDTVFARCSSGDDGGGAQVHYLGPTTTNASLLVDGAHFENCTAMGSGGGLQLRVEGATAGTTFAVQRSSFVGNNASGVSGGGAIQIELPQDSPQNLRFVGSNDSSLWRNQSSGRSNRGPGDADDDDELNPYYPYKLPPDLENEPCSGCGSYPNGCSSCTQFQPYPGGAYPINPLKGMYRRWEATNAIAITNSSFSRNTAYFEGGAIAVPGGGAISVQNTTIEYNDATTLFGGGASIGGTVQLAVSNSSVHRNTCGQRGCQLFSSSGASITFDSSSVMELGCSAGGDCSAGFSAVQVGNVTWSGGSAITCAAGYQLLNSSAIGYIATFESWTLQPPSIFPPNCKLKLDDEGSSALGNTPFHSNCTVVQNKSNCPCYFSDNPFGGVYSSGFGRAPVTPSVLVSTLSYQCRACPRNTYNPTPPTLGAANINNTNRTIGTCLPCPYGSSCADGVMVATRGFWGVDGSASGGILGAFRCPTGYCCDTETCGSIDSCVGNRGGTLCGACAPGFAQTIGSTGCRHTSECGGAEAAWFVPAALLLAALFALYARSSQLGPVDGWPLNAVQPTIYFYQMAQMLPVGSTTADSVQAVITGLFSMDVHTSGACPFPSLTTLQAIELQFAVPALVAALLAIGYAVESWQYHRSAARSDPSAVSPATLYQLSILKSLELAYSTALSTTFQLLHCVDLRPAGGSSVLFRSAVDACGVWQWPIYLVGAALLLPLCAALAVAAGLTGCATKLALPPAVSGKLRAPYRQGCGHWEAVQALHRLVVVAVYTFNNTDSAVTAMLQTVVCLIALVVHASCRPFTNDSANRAQTMLLTLLVIDAQLNVPQAMLDSSAVVASDHAIALMGRLRNAEAVLLLVPTVVVGAALLALAWKTRGALAAKARSLCAALVRCPGAAANAVVNCLCAWCCDGDEEAPPLDEPLLPDSASSDRLVSNSRGLRLTQHPTEDEE
jgi:hypothetical protein